MLRGGCSSCVVAVAAAWWLQQRCGGCVGQRMEENEVH